MAGRPGQPGRIQVTGLNNELAQTVKATMKIQISGRHIDAGDALRTHVTERLDAIMAKYFERSMDAHVTFAREGATGFRTDIRVHIGAGMDLEAEGQAHEIYAAFDLAAERIEKRVRRYKRRLNEHHHSKGLPVPTMAQATAAVAPAQTYVLSGEAEDEHGEAPSEPLVIAETTTHLATLTVSEAVMRLELSSAPALMFKNRAHGGYNVVFRRSDGHIGWIDPADLEPVR
jgi:ribosomal subunit interface protein